MRKVAIFKPLAITLDAQEALDAALLVDLSAFSTGLKADLSSLANLDDFMDAVLRFQDAQRALPGSAVDDMLGCSQHNGGTAGVVAPPAVR